MKIVTLNIWGGRAGKEVLLPFFEQYKNSIDLFCLQEVFSAPYLGFDKQPTANQKLDNSMFMNHGMQNIKDTVGDAYATFFHPHFYDLFGLMMVAKLQYPIIESGDVFVHKHKSYEPTEDTGNHARNIQYAKTSLKEKPITVVNFHGLWNGKGKGDSDDRIEQSKKILSFIQGVEGEVVLCGDFNLLPHTKSLQMFEEAGFRNLIKEFNITSTRTSYYKKDIRFADYVFVSKGLEVKDFKVLPEEVSDHAALYLETE